MGKYRQEHADALAQVKEAGAACPFAYGAASTYDPATDAFSGSAGTVLNGFAIKTKGDPERYAALGLTESEAPALFWVPTTYGGTPSVGMNCTFAGVTLTAKFVDLLAPDGVTIAARIIAAR